MDRYCFDYPPDFCNSSNIFNSNLPLLSYDVNSPVSVASFPDAALPSDYMVVPQMEAGFRDFSAGEECWPPYSPMLAENWGIQGKAADESDQVKVGRYSAEERKDRILRYLKKRNQRNFNKTIKYACRKTLADKRVRVRGRFAKNNEASQDEILMDSASFQLNYSFQDEMVKFDEEYWIQVAMDNLGHFPYLGS
ncbi:putative zinc finger protein CONSTANS-LIKE 11 [Salvia hispanica]|uniref:putative zinc finger protein CONSTANS-LIKE 11 n=1 Tax=Salvia hispanica TaxID=49212 RepID=UPI0020091497|nr:putative zinc finger protein CONSTANS-LIKE 11 [Salvia hispanica]